MWLTYELHSVATASLENRVTRAESWALEKKPHQGPNAELLPLWYCVWLRNPFRGPEDSGMMIPGRNQQTMASHGFKSIHSMVLVLEVEVSVTRTNLLTRDAPSKGSCQSGIHRKIMSYRVPRSSTIKELLNRPGSCVTSASSLRANACGRHGFQDLIKKKKKNE